MIQFNISKNDFTLTIVLDCFLIAEETWPDLHFTTDYILYNWVCDE